MKINCINNNYNIIRNFPAKILNNKNLGCSHTNLYNDSYSFKGNQVPVYAVDMYGQYQRFDSECELIKKLNLPGTISDCVKGKINTKYGYIFIKADDVETINEKGEKVLDVKKLRTLYVLKNIHTIYSVDKDGNYQKYKSTVDASKKLQVKQQHVSYCLSGEYKTVGGYTFVRAQEIESVDDQGEIVVDRANPKVIEALEKMNKTSIPVYALDYCANYKRYDDINDAARDLDTHSWYISDFLSGKSYIVKGYYFVKADDVETIVDDEKILDLIKLKTLFVSMDNKAIYVIDKDGNYKKYPNANAVADSLGCSRQNISHCLSGKQNTVKNCYIVRAQDIETVNDDGEIVLDENKLSSILKSN